MKYTILREQQFFFDQHHYIEFDGLLSTHEQEVLQKALSKQAKDARDVSHMNEAVKSITHKAALAKLASELTRVRELRFAFDELLTPPFHLTNLHNEICIQGLVCALYLTLDQEEGHGIFATSVMDLSSLPLKSDRRYFLIAWAERKAKYVLQPKDIHTHDLKKRGYVFGDRLKEEWHPTLCR